MELADIARFSPAAQRQILEQLGQTAGKADKPGKYHSRKCAVTLPESGKQITFDSERVRPIVYRADFTYRERTGDGWRPVVEDVKGVRTKEYNMKRKMMLEKFGVRIREV